MSDLVEALIYLTLNKNALKFLILIKNSWVQVSKVAPQIGVSRGTAHYYAKKLEEMGIVECKRVAGLKFCKATKDGITVLNVLSRREPRPSALPRIGL